MCRINDVLILSTVVRYSQLQSLQLNEPSSLDNHGFPTRLSSKASVRVAMRL